MNQHTRQPISWKGLILLTALITARTLHSAEAAGIRIESPVERAIFQRNTENLAPVPVECSGVPEKTDAVEVRALDRTTQQPAGDWTALAADAKGDVFQTRLTLPAGWYQLELRALRGGKVVANGSVAHVGVGEVFVTCGQSNSANHGQPPQKAHEERVSSGNFQTGLWVHGDDPQPGATGKGGSPWALLGDMLVKKYNVPVGFICVGVGGTSVSYWTPKAAGYARLKKALLWAGPRGVRTVLWHQGESDSIVGTSAENYARMLGQCIAQSRKDAGWDVPWGVALASYHPSPKATAQRQSAVVAGQKQVIAATKGVFQGPETDSFHARGWLSDSVHFNATGLHSHAQGWAEALKTRIPTSTMPSRKQNQDQVEGKPKP